MACQAIGRCRICARKHKIAVFGGAEEQHFFIEKANLKLIILNTVCIGCIGKIERFVKKMDLDMVFNDYIKDENGGDAKPRNVRLSDRDNSEGQRLMVENERTIKSQESNQQADNSSESTAMDVDHPAQREKNTKETASCNSCIGCGDVPKNDAQARPQYAGDSQSAITAAPRRSIGRKIGQETFVIIESSDKLHRKRPRNVIEKHSAEEQLERNSGNATAPFSSPSAPTIAFVDCGPIADCSASAERKVRRFLSCDFCKKEFTHTGDLNKHRRKHTGEKPYQCNQCQRNFAHASNLARHQRVHSGERPFVCPQCARTFTRRDKLAIHTAAGRCSINTPTSTPLEELS